MATRVCGCCGKTTDERSNVCDVCGVSDAPVDILTVVNPAPASISATEAPTMNPTQNPFDSKTILFSLLMAGAVRVPAIKSALDAIGIETVVSFMAGVGVWLRARTGKPLTLPNLFGLFRKS
jgi:RNA polymerase subunit RPABC4/transcription elongation factor Spt4